ncbi:MAG TPA: hypothetical protein VFE46_00715 [Pirellulales bacterium]|jgi:hypothetical protein|nr:hypothetical protein [Pirellulales bacterium]
MNQSEDLVSPQRLRTSQIIAGALLLGLLNFCLITLWLVQIQNQGHGFIANADFPAITCAALFMGMVNVPLSFVMPNLTTQRAIKQIVSGKWEQKPADNCIPLSPNGIIFQQLALYFQRKAAASGKNLQKPTSIPDQLTMTYQTSLIVGLALLEGAAFLAVMAYLMEAHWLALAMVGMITMVMLIKFPTANKVRAWLLAQADQIEQLRQTSGTNTAQEFPTASKF